MNIGLNDDIVLCDLIKEEETRQKQSIELIASENYTSKAVMDCLGSILTNKYSEGLPGKRYYGGNEVVDKIETLCINRALEAYRLKSEDWGVNVQPYSGSSANMAVYTGLLECHDRIMGLDLPSGGHLTHGYYTSKKKVSATSKYFESLGYGLDKDGYIDYDNLETMAERFKPKLLICGYSAYPRDLDYVRFREIANKCGAYLLCDMAHFSGLVATQEVNNPFDYCDIVTTTTHKTLRGPRAGMIFYKKEYENQINSAVFPGLQGGPHEHQIAGIATQLYSVMKPEFKDYIINVKKNAKKLGELLVEYGYKLITGGTENHLLLIDLKNMGISGSKVEKICETVNISLNKNSVQGDKSALNPGGVRIGTCCLTTRGLKEKDMYNVAELLDKTIKCAVNIQKKNNIVLLKDFVKYLDNNEEVDIIKGEVVEFISKFELY